MISGLRLVSKQHSRRAGRWLPLSTTGSASDQHSTLLMVLKVAVSVVNFDFQYEFHEIK